MGEGSRMVHSLCDKELPEDIMCVMFPGWQNGFSFNVFISIKVHSKDFQEDDGLLGPHKISTERLKP